MTDPLAFLQTAHARAEQAAHAAAPRPWEAHPPTDDGDGWEITARGPGYNETRWIVGAESGGGVYDEADARHIVLHDPAAVLRRIAAERKMLAEHQPERVASLPLHETCSDLRCDCSQDVATCGTCAAGHYYDAEPETYPCATVRLLAEAWGWQEEQR